jgi:hypothetical protein
VIWAAAKQFYAEHSQLPGVAELEAAVIDRMNSDEPFDEAEAEELNITFDMFEGLREQELQPSRAQKWASELLEEKLFAETQDLLRGEVVADLPALLEAQAASARAIKSISSDAASGPISFNSLADLSSRPPTVDKQPTGCQFLDEYMGGQAAKEVYGLAAPYGVCKTTLAIQLVVERAQYAHAKWQEEGCQGYPARVYLCSYEETMESLQVRILSNWAQADRSRIESGKVDEMSTSNDHDSFHPYERSRWGEALASGQRVLGERERIEAAIGFLKEKTDCGQPNPYCNIGFFDFTGADPQRLAQGAEMAQGIAAAIQADQAKWGNPGVSMVVVDHANAAAECRMDFYGLDPSREKRHLVGNFPKALKQNVAAPMNCPVWLMHQLNTSAQTKGIGVLPQITDFAEAKNFAEYCDYVFMVGMKNENDLCVLVNAKQRRTEKKRPTVIQVDGMLCTVRDTSSTYRVDNCRIVPLSDFSLYADDDVDDIDDMSASRGAITQDNDIGM